MQEDSRGAKLGRGVNIRVGTPVLQNQGVANVIGERLRQVPLPELGLLGISGSSEEEKVLVNACVLTS